MQSPDALGDGIEQALNPTETMKTAAERERGYRFYKLDGRAGARVKEKIKELGSRRKK